MKSVKLHYRSREEATGFLETLASSSSSTATTTAQSRTTNFAPLIESLMKLPENQYCFDCGSKGRQPWVSVTLGVFLSINCAGVHRSCLGVHISFIRHASMDTWQNQNHVLRVLCGGNKIAQAWFDESGIGAPAREFKGGNNERWTHPAKNGYEEHLGRVCGCDSPVKREYASGPGVGSGAGVMEKLTCTQPASGSFAGGLGCPCFDATLTYAGGGKKKVFLTGGIKLPSTSAVVPMRRGESCLDGRDKSDSFCVADTSSSPSSAPGIPDCTTGCNTNPEQAPLNCVGGDSQTLVTVQPLDSVERAALLVRENEEANRRQNSLILKLVAAIGGLLLLLFSIVALSTML